MKRANEIAIRCLLILMVLYASGLSHETRVTGAALFPAEKSLKEIIHQLEKESGYRMLYRDALIAGKSADFTINENWNSEFPELLQQHGLSVRIDDQRKQMVIYPAGQMPTEYHKENITLMGFVIDNQTGERLPFANITWSQESDSIPSKANYSHGTQTNIQGQFRILVSGQAGISLSISYVGYHPLKITLGTGELEETAEHAIRLQPAAYEGREIVITGSRRHTKPDTLHQDLLSMGTYSTLGEANSIRMLQTLPSVGQGMALADGAFIRGSSPDALQVLLDGSVIYNHSHLFGMVDSFNDDAIRISNFYYDVTPARFQSPPGGTLHLITRTGSLHEFRGNAGISNSAVSGSLDGPLVPGQASWLLSGRTSILNTVNWFQTAEMVAWGLDIDRKNSLSDEIQLPQDRIVTPGGHQVHFHDLHGKVFWEDRYENRWVVSGYSGYNNTSQDADRLTATSSENTNERFETQNYETLNRWGNNSATLGVFRPVSADWLMEARSGISYYHTRYLKEDFSYQRPGQTRREQMLIIDEFANQSELTHWNGAVNFLFTPPGVPLESIRFGAEIHGYRSAYLERSLNHPGYFQRTTPLLLETYGESVWRIFPDLFSVAPPAELSGGARVQYYSDGNFLRLSPRLHLDLFPKSAFSMGFGYSRTYQYLYKLSFYNLTTSNIWITATKDQPPAAVDQWSAGLYLRPWSPVLFQVEAYHKIQENLRFHEINIQSVQTPLSGDPWFADNDGFARGIEFLFRYSADLFQFTQTYTLGVAELRNERLNQGEWFYAQWDRRHQFQSMISLRVLRGMNVNLSWLYATGVPDRLDIFRNSDGRLGDYSRIDLSFTYHISRGSHKWAIQGGIYNALNRQNPWYRDWVLVRERRLQRDRLTPVQADVYDLGFQPSFSIRYFIE